MNTMNTASINQNIPEHTEEELGQDARQTSKKAVNGKRPERSGSPSLRQRPTKEQSKVPSPKKRPAAKEPRMVANADLTFGENLSSDVIDLYLGDIRNQALLTAAEEIQLAKAIEAGHNATKKLKQPELNPNERTRLTGLVEKGEAARERVVRSNMRLVISIAKKYRNRGLNFLDLIQEGNVGLIIAADKYDYTMGNRFSTYATWWIRQAITRALANHSRTIRLPAHWHGMLIKINQLKRVWEQKQQRAPTVEELAAELEVPPDQINWLMKASQSPIPLEQPYGPEDDTEFGDFLEDEDSPDPANLAAQHMLAAEINDLLGELPPREAEILQLRYGLYDGEFRTFREIGEMFGLSRERIRQLEHDALNKLRFAQMERGWTLL